MKIVCLFEDQLFKTFIIQVWKTLEIDLGGFENLYNLILSRFLNKFLDNEFIGKIQDFSGKTNTYELTNLVLTFKILCISGDR